MTALSSPAGGSQTAATGSSIRALHLVAPSSWPELPRGDAEPAAAFPSPRHSQGQSPLPLEFCLPNGLPAIPRIPEAVAMDASLKIVPWVARLTQAVLEVVAAERPVTQLRSWVAPDIYRRLDRRQQVTSRQLDPRISRDRSTEQVRSVHVCHPAPDIAEASVVTGGLVTEGLERFRALAIRLERRRGRWICTELDWA